MPRERRLAPVILPFTRRILGRWRILAGPGELLFLKGLAQGLADHGPGDLDLGAVVAGLVEDALAYGPAGEGIWDLAGSTMTNSTRRLSARPLRRRLLAMGRLSP